MNDFGVQRMFHTLSLCCPRMGEKGLREDRSY
jgi:hypothetical protein